MKAAATLAGLFVLALSSRAMAEVDCATATTFTPKEMSECIKKWTGNTDLPPPFKEATKSAEAFNTFSAKNINDILPAIKELEKELAKAKAKATKTDTNTPNEPNDAKDKASKAASDAGTKHDISKTLLEAATNWRTATTKALTDNDCDNDLVLCLDRDGQPYSNEEETEPFLLPYDKVAVLVFSYTATDTESITLTARNVRRVTTSFNKESPRTEPKDRSKDPILVKNLEATVSPDSAFLEIEFRRTEGGSADYSIRVESRRHYIEFGLMLPFAYRREVTSQGSVKYGMEPDLAFTITVFPGARSSSDPWQSRKRRWFGLMAGADLTNQVSDKRYYLGLDFSPVSGLALNAGLAILPWEYIPNPEQVPDVLTSTIEPDQRYRASFFFGARMTPEVFDTVKAAYEALRK